MKEIKKRNFTVNDIPFFSQEVEIFKTDDNFIVINITKSKEFDEEFYIDENLEICRSFDKLKLDDINFIRNSKNTLIIVLEPFYYMSQLNNLNEAKRNNRRTHLRFPEALNIKGKRSKDELFGTRHFSYFCFCNPQPKDYEQQR